MTIEDIKNCSNDMMIIEYAKQYIKESYQWIEDNDAKIEYCVNDYGNGPKYSAKVYYGYNWTWGKKTLKAAIIEALKIFDDERESCRKFNDDIDAQYD